MQVHTEVFDGVNRNDEVDPKECLGRIANWIEKRIGLIEVISIVPTGYCVDAQYFDQYIVIYKASERMTHIPKEKKR